MKITQVFKRRGYLNEIRFDDGTYILLDRKISEEYSLKEGTDVTEKQAEDLENLSDSMRCKNRAMYYLSCGDHSVKGLREKLLKAGFTEPFVSETLNRLKELDLLDDRAFCQRFAQRLREKNVSYKEIKEKAFLKGIPSGIVKEVLESMPDDETQSIKNLLETKYAEKLYDEESAKKVIASLLRKGYKFSDIRAAIRDIQQSEEI